MRNDKIRSRVHATLHGSSSKRSTRDAAEGGKKESDKRRCCVLSLVRVTDLVINSVSGSAQQVMSRLYIMDRSDCTTSLHIDTVRVRVRSGFSSRCGGHRAIHSLPIVMGTRVLWMSCRDPRV